MIQCPDCKQPIAPENYQMKDNTTRCPECKSVQPLDRLTADDDPRMLLQIIPPGVKSWKTPKGAILRYRRFAWAKTFFYLTAITLIIQLTEPAIGHLRDANLSTVWPEVILTSVAAGALVWLIYELCGKNEIRLTGGQLTLFIGVGPLGIRHRFETYDIAEINLVVPDGSNPKHHPEGHIKLTLTNGRSFTFFKSADINTVRYFYLWLRQKTICANYGESAI